MNETETPENANETQVDWSFKGGEEKSIIRPQMGAATAHGSSTNSSSKTMFSKPIFPHINLKSVC